MIGVGTLRKRPGDSNVWERWNGAEWLFYRWADITKASTETHGGAALGDGAPMPRTQRSEP